jgi:NAD(P)H-flavin reductase
MFTAKESDIIIPDLERTDQDTWEPIPYRIINKKTENNKLMTLVLEPAEERSIEPIQPGQFNMLYVFGVGEIPISTSSLAVTHPQIVHTIQDVGLISKAINQLSPKDVVGIRGPFGSTWPVKKAYGKDVMIMAGGVGLCPVRPLIESLLSDREQIGELNILYGSRSPENIIFHQDIISWQSDPGTNFLVTVDHAFSSWHGNIGVVTRLIPKSRFDPENTVVYICGPEVMMRFGAYACLDEGIPEDQIFLSMERNMKCAIGFCGHCQYGPHFLCKDGAVFSYPQIKPYLNVQDL